MTSQPRPGRMPWYALGCIALTALCVVTAAIGGAAGYFVARSRPTATPTEFAQREPTATPSPAARATASPAAPRQATPTPSGEAGWTWYRDEGYLRLQHPPGWTVTAIDPAPGCHCAWLVLNGAWPDVPRVSATTWLSQGSHGTLPEDIVWIEIRRIDPAHPLGLDLGQVRGSRVVGQHYLADAYMLFPVGDWPAYRYRDEHGREWVILLHVGKGFASGIPEAEFANRILGTIAHD
ncbi:MAG: hypothetical protein RMK01_12255 [Thermomicrobium sp.]|nr:hypothetical protein [Thermomicrobium sp.]MDW8060836.1 hypothetical protein [Thermomicrobium sp.]